MRSPGCATMWPSMQAHTELWQKTCMLPSLLSRLKAHGQNLKPFILVVEETIHVQGTNSQSFHHSIMSPGLHPLPWRSHPALFSITKAASVIQHTFPHAIWRCLSAWYPPTPLHAATIAKQHSCQDERTWREWVEGWLFWSASFLWCSLRFPENSGGGEG